MALMQEQGKIPCCHNSSVTCLHHAHDNLHWRARRQDSHAEWFDPPRMSRRFWTPRSCDMSSA
jgi:hypothetical protein